MGGVTHSNASSAGTCQGSPSGGERVLALVERVRFNGRQDIVRDELFLDIQLVVLGDVERIGPLSGLFELVRLSQIESECDYLRLVLFLQPSYADRSVQPA